MVANLSTFNSKFKKYHFFIFLLIFTVGLDILFGYIYDRLYFTLKSMGQDRVIYSALVANEDVLVFGSSRAYHHYNPKIINIRTGMSSYNLGKAGQNIYYHLALLESAMQRNIPQIVILELMTLDFQKTSKLYETEKLGVLLPFARKSDPIYNTVMLRGWNEKYKLLSKIYPLNSKQLFMIRNNFTKVTSHYHGFAGLDRVWKKTIKTKNVEVINDYDPLKLEALDRFIKLCQKNNINILICISPHYVNNVGDDPFADISKRLKKKFNLEINSFRSEPKFIDDSTYFSDPFHLNKRGADLYTRMICDLVSKKNKIQEIANKEDN